MFSFSYDSDQAWYIIWKVKTRNKGMNVKNTLCITLSYFIGEFTPQLFYQITYLFQPVLLKPHKY